MSVVFLDDHRPEEYEEYVPEGNIGLDDIDGPSEEELAELERELNGGPDFVDLGEEDYPYDDEEF